MKNLFTNLTSGKILYLMLFLSLTIACREKGTSPAPFEVIGKSEISPTEQPTVLPLADIPSYPTTGMNAFDWENKYGFVIPMNERNETVPYLIELPWVSGSNANISYSVRRDYKKDDGWELVYSSLKDNISAPNIYFMLYNKYRGLVRLYYHNPYPAPFFALLAHKLEVKTTPEISSNFSSIFNFADQTVVDVKNNSSKAVMSFSFFGINISDGIKLDNNVITSVQQQGVDMTNFPSLNGAGQVIFNEINDLIPVIGESNSKTLEDNLKKGIPDGASPLFSLNLVNNVPQYLQAKLNANINTKGRGETFKLFDLNFAISGYEQKPLNGEPIYNQPFGVFTLEQRPIIKLTNNDKNTHPYIYTLDIKSIRYIFNPFVMKVADIANFKQEIIASRNLNTTDVQKSYFKGQELSATEALNIEGVRVSFEVIPKNGSPKVTIVKTFKADIK